MCDIFNILKMTTHLYTILRRRPHSRLYICTENALVNYSNRRFQHNAQLLMDPDIRQCLQEIMFVFINGNAEIFLICTYKYIVKKNVPTNLN